MWLWHFRDNVGYVNVEELKFVMRHLEDKMTEDEIEEMIKEADHDNDGQISYEGEGGRLFGFDVVFVVDLKWVFFTSLCAPTSHLPPKPKSVRF